MPVMINLDIGSALRLQRESLKVKIVSYYSRLRMPAQPVAIHKTVNIGILFSGKTDFVEVAHGNRLVRCPFPCAYLDVPGVPTLVMSSCEWEIFYVSYDAAFAPLLTALGLEMHPEYWGIHVSGVMRELLSELLETAGDIYKRGCADKIDALCAAMLMEIIRSRLSKDDISPDKTREKVERVHNELCRRFNRRVDIGRLARENGMTLRTLRRHWDKYYPVSMKHFVVLKRVDEAKRLLETGSDSIGEIAGFCGFKNPYYFSKKFREIAGVPPLQYRRKTRET